MKLFPKHKQALTELAAWLEKYDAIIDSGGFRIWFVSDVDLDQQIDFADPRILPDDIRKLVDES